ncbi:hypothetical protein V5T82_14795 [Magnetovibrio sp. PR-2]|uniref:hypothetical protein n=1 Tax=Magnetovibrio sp. PR-2 TaxID=3120356 RepID=UPI002FCE389B
MDGLTDQKNLDARLEGHLDTSVENLKLVKLDDAQDGQLVLPGDEAFLAADFVRDGYDLILDGGSDVGLIFIPEYFSSDTPPALNLGDAGMISADLAGKLAGPMAPAQTAQIGIGAQPTVTTDTIGESIGSVNDITGTVNATRVDGTQVTLGQGDPIFQGDVIETADASNVGIVFADDTLFSLEAGGRMVMDEMVYDPDTQTGVFETTVVKGVFSFVSGQSAKVDPDAMVINTPKTTIGIRGTSGIGKTGVEEETADAEGLAVFAAGTTTGDGAELAQAPGPVDSFVLMPDPGSKFVGEVVIGGKTVNTPFGSVNIGDGFVSDPVPLSPAEVLSTFGGAMVNLTNIATKHAENKTQQAENEAREAQDQAEQQKQEAEQVEEQAADAEAEAAQAEADAEAAQAEAEAAQAEAEALKAAAEAEQDAAAKAEAEAAAAEAEARAAEAEVQAQAEAEAAQQKAQEAEALKAEAQAKFEQAQLAEQQAQEAFQQQAQAKSFQEAVVKDAALQKQMFTQFEQTGEIAPELEQQFVEPAEASGEQDGPNNPQDGGPDAGDQAAQGAFEEAIASGGSEEDAFEAAARAAMEAGGDEYDPNDPAVLAARAAYEEALANGATPEEAMLAAQKAVDQFEVEQQLQANATASEADKTSEEDEEKTEEDGENAGQNEGDTGSDSNSDFFSSFGETESETEENTFASGTQSSGSSAGANSSSAEEDTTNKTKVSTDDDYVETDFDQTYTMPDGGHYQKGGDANTNYYFHWEGYSAGGDYTIEDDAGGSNQMSLDTMVDMKFKITADTTTSGSMIVWGNYSGSGNSFAEISYTGISKFLLSNVTVNSFGTNTYATEEGGDILKLSALSAGQTAYGIALTDGAESYTITAGDQILFANGGDDDLTFAQTGDGGKILGNGGADDFFINEFTDGWEFLGGSDSSNDTFTYSHASTNVTDSLYVYFDDEEVYVRDSGSTKHNKLEIDKYDDFTASNQADQIHVYGGSYNKIYGGTGDDTFKADADMFTSSSFSLLDGGAGGADSLSVQVASSTAFDLSDYDAKFTNFETVTITGSSATNSISVTGQTSTATTFVGSNYADTMVGGSAVDTFVGGAGFDTLTGNGGADIFSYSGTSHGQDTITDFTSGADKFSFDSTAFSGSNNAGTLDSIHFVSGSGAVAAASNDYYIFDTSTHILYYDADGNGTGAQIGIADLSSNGGSVAATDIVMSA